MIYGINRRRINYFRTEVTKFGCFYIAKFGDSISRWNHTRISSHKAIHICPYLQTVGIERRSNDGSRIIRTAATEIGYFSGCLVGRNKARHQCYFRDRAESLFYQFVGQISVNRMFVMLLFSFDKSTRIEPLGILNQLGNNDRWKALAIAYDCVRSLRGKVFNQVNTLENILQFIQQFANLTLQRHLPFSGRNHLFNHFHMTINNFAELALIGRISGSRHFRCVYQFISDASQCGNYYNNRFAGRCRLYNSLYT